jgi:hypothetical protein
MAKEKHKEEVVVCPVGRLFADIEKTVGKNSDFFDHFNKSRVEFLKAIRSLLDEKIEKVEKKQHKKKKATKIAVE